MKFLVTGGTGFIGQRVVQQLIKKNIEVIATDIILEEESNNLSNRIKDSKLNSKILHIEELDISNKKNINHIISQNNISAIPHKQL